MTQDDVINMLKDAFDEANAPNATESDFDNAAKVLACVDMLTKSNFFSDKAVFSAVEAEMKVFLSSQTFLERMKGNLPSVKEVLCRFRCLYIPSPLQEIDANLM